MRPKRASNTETSSIPSSIHQCCHDCIIHVKSGSNKCRGSDQCRSQIGISCFNKNHVCLVCTTTLCKCIECSYDINECSYNINDYYGGNQIITIQGKNFIIII